MRHTRVGLCTEGSQTHRVSKMYSVTSRIRCVSGKRNAIYTHVV